MPGSGPAPKLPNAKAAAKMKQFWGAALDRLKESIE